MFAGSLNYLFSFYYPHNLFSQKGVYDSLLVMLCKLSTGDVQ